MELEIMVRYYVDHHVARDIYFRLVDGRPIERLDGTVWTVVDPFDFERFLLDPFVVELSPAEARDQGVPV